MKIENAPTLFTALSSLIDFDSGGNAPVGNLEFEYMQVGGWE